MIWLAFLFGIVSSLHCTLMCGPLQAVVMGQWLRNGKKSNWFIYHAGRLSTYIILGFAAGIIGTAIGIPDWQSEFTILAGLVLLTGYFGLKTLSLDRKINSVFTPILMRLQSKSRGSSGKFRYYISGGLNGLLPCGMVYAALIPAALNETIALSGLAMLAFGIGTLPLLLSVNLAGTSFFARYPKLLAKLIPVSVVLISSLLILRGMELDIPYISPEFQVPASTADGCQ